MQTQEMSRDKQINFRVSAEEYGRFEALASKLGLSLASMIRMLVKEKYDELETKKQLSTEEDDFRWKDHHTDILTIVEGEKDPITTDDISSEMHGGTFHYDGKWAGLGLALNQLVRNGYLRRLKTGYLITPKARGRK